MVKRKKTNKKFEQTQIMLLIILSLTAFGLMVALISTDEKNHLLDKKQRVVTELLRGSPGVAGRTCGILSEVEAKDILPTRKLSATFTNQPVENKVIVEDNKKGIHWSDSCRYVDPDNSNIYVEMFIDTYGDDDEARADLLGSLPKGGAIETVNNPEYDELYYSSGAWFARQHKVVIKVSANDGRSGDLRDFSNNVFTKLSLQK